MNNLDQTSKYFRPKYRPDIDGLRALAVLSVVIYHAFPGLLKGGFIGVDVFFVISGYLISTIIFENLDQGTFNFLQFYARRITRIFPALIVVLFFCFILGWFTLLASDYKQLGKHVVAGAGFSSNFVLWNESGYFDKSALTKPLLHLWSLGIEEQFYLVLPLMLILANKSRFGALKIVSIFAFASFILNMEKFSQNATSIFYSPQSRFWELLIGSILARITINNSFSFDLTRKRMDPWLSRFFYMAKLKTLNNKIRNTVSCIGFILLLIGLMRIDNKMAFPGKLALIPVGGSLLILAAGSNAWINRKVLSNRIAIWFGLISYPLYLWHWPLLTFTRIIQGDTPSGTIRIGVVIASIALAWITYRFVETPLRSNTCSKAKISILTLLVCMMGLSGYGVYRGDGFPTRSINRLNETVSAAQDYNWQEGFRFDECFIRNDIAKTSNFSSKCGLPKSKSAPMLLLWGDSYSASLYRGFLKQGNATGFIVSQFSGSGCPPILDFYVSKRKECFNSNNYVFDQLKKLHPDALVLAANWQLYDGDVVSGWEKFDSNLFTATIKSIKELGITNITIVGQLPVYTVNQADMLTRRFLWSKVDKVTYRNFKTSVIPADEMIRNLSKRLKITFISPLDHLCNPNGCNISVPGDSIIPMSWDEGHLTNAGSEFLVSEFFKHNLIKLP